MNNITITVQRRFIFRIISILISGGILIGFAGCGGKYGSFKRDPQIAEAFQNSQLSPEYKYFYNAHHNRTYAIIGIDPKYRIESKFWREIEADSEEFKTLTNRIWEDYGYYSFGANIFDPSGSKIGIWYSSIYEATVKFVGDNEIVVMIYTPFLWGPDDGLGGRRIGF